MSPTIVSAASAPPTALHQDIWARLLVALIEVGALPRTAATIPCPVPAEMMSRLYHDSGAQSDLVAPTVADILDMTLYHEEKHGPPALSGTDYLFLADGVAAGTLFVEDPFDARWRQPANVLGNHANQFRALGLMRSRRHLDAEVDHSAVMAQAEALVTKWITEAAKKGDSDLAFVPFSESVARLYATVDGLQVVRLEYPMVPVDGRPPFLAIANTLLRLAQHPPGMYQAAVDGAFSIRNGQRIEIRLSMRPVRVAGRTWPGLFARLLHGDAHRRRLDELGLPADDLRLFKALLSAAEGLVLVTGPTGSGKTTTLYAGLRWIQETQPGRSIQTIEDPVEAAIPGIVQTQINDAAGMGFLEGTRSLMRTFPRVILIGEIRDKETAQQAFTLAMTGHLVLATLHTGGTLKTVDRLGDLGVSRHLIAEYLRGVYAQRLIRQVCPHCSTPYRLDEDQLAMQRYGALYHHPHGNDDFRREGPGCNDCGQAGYRGRVLLTELLVVDPATADAIEGGIASRKIAETRRAEGDPNLWDRAFGLARAGTTTLDEATRVLGPLPAYGRTFSRGREDGLV